MFAVIRTGGKQYRVSEGQRVRVERLNAQVGDELRFDAMLIGGDEGAATRVGAAGEQVGQVRATVCDHGRARKIEVIKFKRRKNYRRTLGHRQQFTTLEIGGIELAGMSGEEAPAQDAAPENHATAKAPVAEQASAGAAGEES